MTTQTIRNENPQTTVTYYGIQQRPEVALLKLVHGEQVNPKSHSLSD